MVKATKAAGKAVAGAKAVQKGAKAARGAGKGIASTSKSINQLDTLVKKGQAPKSITRFDKAGAKHTPVDHVHFKDGSALGKNGVWRHGYKKLTNEEINFLKAHGWKIPE